MKLKSILLAACGGLLALSVHAKDNELSAADKKAGWQLLFDGKSLDGWKVNENPATFSVADGQIVVKGPRSHLFYAGDVAKHDFKNFEISLDIMTMPKANSGVYFHTEFQEQGWPFKGYEIQVNNSHTDPKRTAGIYAIKDNLDEVAKDNVWFNMTIRVEGKRIITAIDGKVIRDFTEPEGWTPPVKFEGRMLGHGTFALQGHDPQSEVHYKNVKVRVLP